MDSGHLLEEQLYFFFNSFKSRNVRHLSDNIAGSSNRKRILMFGGKELHIR